MVREISLAEMTSVSAAAGTAVYENGSWQYGNTCYATAQGAADAGATGFAVNGQYFGTPGNPFDNPYLCSTEGVSC